MATLPVFEQLTSHTFFHRLEERSSDGDRSALICFTSPSCGSCRAFKRVLPAVRELASSRGSDAADLDVFEVDAGESMGLTNEHDVVDLPALFLYRGAEYHASLQAPPDPSALLCAVLAALERPPEEAP
jgi:hypothetical protein